MAGRTRVRSLVRATEGRVRLWAVPLLATMAVAALVAVAILPAGAGAGAATTTHGVQPAEVNLGGAPNDCAASIAGRLPSAASSELRIPNPTTGTFALGTSGSSVMLTVTSGDQILDFVVTGSAAVFDVVVKGGTNSTHFDYDNGGPGAVRADTGLHAPTKGGGNALFNISHVSFCYEPSPAEIRGTVFVDTDLDGVRDGGELADDPLDIRLYQGSSVAQQKSKADGSYSFLVKSGVPTTVCEQGRTGWGQSTPTGTDCAGLGSPGLNEPSGFVFASPTGLNAGNDFGNGLEVCGQTLADSATTFTWSFKVFDQGNAESGCTDKLGAAFEAPGGGQLNFPLVGTGEAAGIGVITKSFPTASAITPLLYSQGSTDTEPLPDGFEVLPWCGLRAKGTGDGNQFDLYLANDSMYPSLLGVIDPVSAAASTACKVAETANAEASQTTVVLIQGDPFWK